MVETARRTSALEGRSAAGEGVTATPAAPAARLSLRAPKTSRAALSKALGLTLPEKPKGTATDGTRAALWLGPDEWLILDEDGTDLMAACATVEALHSAVDVSHRNVAILVSGPNAEATLAAGCPQDLGLPVFPVGAATRTVFGKAEVVLWRTAEDAFRMEVWRSFSDYAFTLLEAGARDAA